MKKLLWLWKCFWGTKYFVTYTDRLKDDEILVFGHKIYISKKIHREE